MPDLPTQAYVALMFDGAVLVGFDVRYSEDLESAEAEFEYLHAVCDSFKIVERSFNTEEIFESIANTLSDME